MCWRSLFFCFFHFEGCNCFEIFQRKQITLYAMFHTFDMNSSSTCRNKERKRKKMDRKWKRDRKLCISLSLQNLSLFPTSLSPCFQIFSLFPNFYPLFPPLFNFLSHSLIPFLSIGYFFSLHTLITQLEAEPLLPESRIWNQSKDGKTWTRRRRKKERMKNMESFFHRKGENLKIEILSITLFSKLCKTFHPLSQLFFIFFLYHEYFSWYKYSFHTFQ